MERNQIIGFILIFATLMVWTITTSPSKEELEKSKHLQDSIALVQQITEKGITIKDTTKAVDRLEENSFKGDTVSSQEKTLKFGAFGASAIGIEKDEILENELIKIVFTNKGGKIKEAKLKKHYKTIVDSNGVETKELVKLLSSPENKFEYALPVPEAITKTVNTNDLYFTAEKKGNSISFKAFAGTGAYFEQKYELSPDNYTLQYEINTVGIGKILAPGIKSLPLFWENHLAKYEKGTQFEQSYSTIYFKEKEERRDYCSCTAADTKDLSNKNIEWISNVNQFFNTSLVTKEQAFTSAVLTTIMTDLKTSDDVKIVTSDIKVPLSNPDASMFAMTMYVGPNEFDRLQAFNNDLEEIIPFGSSIFGTINRWAIRPFFDFLSSYIGSKGIVIILLIFLIKMLLYPLMYKMLFSQAKMGALKPELAHLKEKYKDDTQKQQMETMKIYREYGVSPLGGCLPMILQMPIWYALFRFFPASITFRQEPFLWANDLSSYDVLFMLPYEIPFFGAHVSLFTLLWAVSTIVYTYYNMQNMDMSANPAMKYVQYLMPVMFLAFFNNYASGLTCYMFFSNMINILQTVVTKNYIFDEAKIRQQLLKEKDKPKKKSGFQAKLEEAMNQQQAIQAQKKKK
ncbi:MAG: membrane protein insertase YidC [Saprospiraceae bacterium]|nr:membrane protein insertase YidC [Saprospiraceae bacterium]